MLKLPPTTARREWWNVRNATSGMMRFSFFWTPIVFDHVVPPMTIGGRTPLVPAIGVVRVKVIEATGLVNMEAVNLMDLSIICYDFFVCFVRLEHLIHMFS